MNQNTIIYENSAEHAAALAQGVLHIGYGKGRKWGASKASIISRAMAVTFALILAVSAGLAWWLSGYDSQVTGENRSADLRRRALRCGLSLLVLGVAVGACMSLGKFGGFVFIGAVLPLALMWTGCLSEVFTRGLHTLIDSPDPREVDFQELNRELDRLSGLVQQRRFQEAITACTQLRHASEGSALALEAMLVRIYDGMFSGQTVPCTAGLAAAHRLCDEGRYQEAETHLIQLRQQDPADLAASIALMRLYARQLHQPTKVEDLLQSLERQSELPPGFVSFARRRVRQWLDPSHDSVADGEGIESLLVKRNQSKSTEPAVTVANGSVSELLSSGQLGTAIEILQTRTRTQPHDFDAWLMLAEAYGRYCCNLTRAKEIIRKMEATRSFSSEQIGRAKTQLEEWRSRQPVNTLLRE